MRPPPPGQRQSATVTDMFLEADDALFRKILYDKAHVLHSFVPDRPDIVYSLRASSHNKTLMCKTSDPDECNFLVRVIDKDCYLFLSTAPIFPVYLVLLFTLYTLLRLSAVFH